MSKFWLDAIDPMKWKTIIGWWPIYWMGLSKTLYISFIALWLAILFGTVAGLLRSSTNPILSALGTVYVEVIRNTPLLVQLFIFVYGLAPLFNNDDFMPLVTALALFAGAYVAEIVRAGIQSVARGQTEAALSVGMTNTQVMWYVILPQAFRRILPPLAGQFISLIKDSSLVAVFAYSELTYAARRVTATTFLGFHPYVMSAILYFIICYALSLLVRYIERRMARSGQN